MTYLAKFTRNHLHII